MVPEGTAGKVATARDEPARLPSPSLEPLLEAAQSPAATPESDSRGKPGETLDPQSQRSTFAEQLDAIRRARSALRAGKSADALAVLDENAGALRGGSLEAEGRLLRIEALAALGRASEARELARRFLADYPNSPLVQRARSFARERAP